MIILLTTIHAILGYIAIALGERATRGPASIGFMCMCFILAPLSILVSIFIIITENSDSQPHITPEDNPSKLKKLIRGF